MWFVNLFWKRHYFIDFAVFMPNVEYMERVCGSWVIVLYVSCMILVSCLETLACLPDICLVACIACDFVYSAFFFFWGGGMFFCFMYCCVVVVVLNAMFTLLLLSKLVIVLIFGL